MSSSYTSQEKLPLVSTHPKKGEGKYVLVIHGGAGTMSREKSTPAQQAEYKAVLAQALRAGYAVLEQGERGHGRNSCSRYGLREYVSSNCVRTGVL